MLLIRRDILFYNVKYKFSIIFNYKNCEINLFVMNYIYKYKVFYVVKKLLW